MMTKKKRTLIFSICYLAYTLIYVARLNLSIASPALLENGFVNDVGIGVLGGVFSVVYAFGRLINGYISDKKSPAFMISFGLTVVGISNLIISLMPPLYAFVELWGANAYAQSMLWSSILKETAHIYDEQSAKKKTSYMVTSVAAGNVVGIIANKYLINNFGFRFAFIIPGILVLIACAAVLLTFEKHEAQTEKSKHTKHLNVKELFADKSIKRVVFPAFFHGMIKDNISVWMTLFFVDMYGINLEEASWFILFIPIVGLIGRLLYPVCYKLSGYREHRVSAYALAVSAAASACMCISKIPPIAAASFLSIIYAAVSVTNTSILSIFPLRFTKTDNIASVSGIMDFATYFGAGVSSFIYGFLVNKFGYIPMYASWILVSLISAVILLPYTKINGLEK